MFKDGRTIVDDEKRSGRPPVVSADLVQNVHQESYERRRFAIRNFRVNFHKFHTLFSRDYES
jgi:hypothetical protein